MKNKTLGSLGRNKIKSFPKVVIGNLHRLGTTIRRGSPIKTLGDDSRKDNGGKNNYGFTLIELLVVVLIIGILSAVALPNYQQAVDKARVKRILPVIQNIRRAEDIYRLANGSYTLDFNELSIEIPAKTISADGSSITATDGTYYSLDDQGTYKHIDVRDGKTGASIYAALGTETWLCYPFGTARGRNVCKMLGCTGNLNSQSCSFKP